MATILWRVYGELSTDSGSGGEETWLYATNERALLPDLARTFYAPGSSNGRDWYQIDRIERLGAVDPGDEEVASFIADERK